MNKDKFFIGIGPGRTGSTWMHKALEKHSEVQMLPIKEIKYFYIKEFIGRTNLLTNLFSKHWAFKTRRKRSLPIFKKAFKRLLTLRSLQGLNLYWHLHFFCMPHNDNWYKKLFPKDKLSGDISPNYSNLSEKYIQEIKELNPKSKIIIGVRNPVERTWSFLKLIHLRFKGKKALSELDKSSALAFIKSEEVLSPNNYSELITRWSKHFPKEQILIYYFEELEENPQKLFNKICTFLEIQPMEIENIKKKRNKGIVEEIPAEYEKELIKLNYKNIEEFAKNYPNKYSLAWLKKYKDIE